MCYTETLAKWPIFKANSFALIFIIGPDRDIHAPSLLKPAKKSLLHILVGNLQRLIPGLSLDVANRCLNFSLFFKIVDRVLRRNS